MTVDELQVLITANTSNLQKEINKANKNIESLQKSANKTSQGVTGAFSKLKQGIISLGIGKVISDSITTGINAIETESKFNTVLGNMANDVNSWATDVSNALGLNITSMQNNIATIYSMTTAMGLANKNALTMSKGVSLLAEDMASFHNINSSEAFNKIRAGLTGETEPLKALGILVDENTIKQYAYQEGIARTGAELTNEQKVLARYIAILRQTSDAQGDLARTIDSPANQLRILRNQVTNLAREFSNFLIPVLNAVLPYIVAFTKVVTTALSSLAKFFGITTSSSSTKSMTSGISDISTGISGVNDGLSSANKNAKKLKGTLAGFDEMNVLQDNSATSGGTGGSGGISTGGVGGGLDFDLSEYDAGLDSISDKADQLVEKMKGVATLVASIGTAFALWKISKSVLDFFINPANLGFFKTMGDLFRVGDVLDALTLGDKFMSLGGAISTVAGVVSLAYGVFDAWANGLDWGNLALMIGGVTLATVGLYYAILPFSTTLAPIIAGVMAVVGGVALLVTGVKDFIENGPTLQNTILMIGGAVAVAVGLATAGLSVLVSAIVGAIALVSAFTVAILLEEPAIKSVTDAQNDLTKAKEKSAEAENDYINAIDNAENSLKRLKDAEKQSGLSGKALYEQVQAGTLDYANMTDAQKEVYKAYLDNEKKQKELKEATEEFNQAKKEETIASYENQLALAKESGSYDDFKKSVIDAFEKGELSAEECRDLIEKSMSEMSDASQQTFMNDLPSDIRNGLDPHKYESTGTKIKKWFSNLWDGIKNVFSSVGTFFKDVGTKIGEAISNAVKSAINSILEKAINTINGFIKAINTAISIINAIPGVNIKKLSLLNVPKLAQGGIVDKPTYAMIGEAGKEAVMPLERNTGWIDQLADKLNAKSNGGEPIKLVVKLGEDTIFDKFIEYTKGKSFETNGEVFAI